jgi:hypothetical protein
MAAASASTPEHNRTAGGTDRPHSSPKLHRRRLLSHLHIQVPVPASSGWSGRPSCPASAPCDAHANAAAHHHQDRPASPSLLRSPTAWDPIEGSRLRVEQAPHTPLARREFPLRRSQLRAELRRRRPRGGGRAQAAQVLVARPPRVAASGIAVEPGH